MSKEELDVQKEIEKYFTVSTGFGKDKLKNFMDIVNKALKQKGERIKELEDKVADIKANCDLAIEGRDVKIKELKQQIVQLKKDVIENESDCANCGLRQENAELKEALKGKRCNCMTYFNFKDLEKENEELKADNDARRFAMNMSEKVEKHLREQLTKATEILEKLSNMEYIIKPPADKVRSLMVKAEKFLKEIKK